MALSVSFARTDLSAAPGGSTASDVTIAHGDPGHHAVTLAVLGPAAQWSWVVVPPDLTVGPGQTAVARFGFRIPRGSVPAPGPIAFSVEVRAGDRIAQVEGVLTVTEFVEISVDLDPRTSETAASAEHRITVRNTGNVRTEATLAAAASDARLGLTIDPAAVSVDAGQQAEAILTVEPEGRSLRGGPPKPFVVSATSGGGHVVRVEGAVRQRAMLPKSTTRVVVVLAVLALVAGLVNVISSDDGPERVAATGETTPSSIVTTDGVIDPSCVAKGHVDQGVTGLTPEDIPTLPPDFSFFTVANEGCTPVRWNPCEPVHYAINPANAPPTGLADVREAFSRLSRFTSMTYVEDPLTDEEGGGRKAYQPERYGERWAPILVHWLTNSSRSTETVAIVGGGFPTRAGDVYVTGNLFLNSGAITNARTRAPLAGGFGNENGFGPIGADGVTWGRVILHELGHIMGLGHVRDSSQLMYPETTDQTIRPGRFGPGDANGLRLLGKEAGCLPSPPFDTPTRLGGDDGTTPRR